MAVTRKPEQEYQQSQQATQAQKAMQQAAAQKPAAYQQGQQVTAAQQALQQAQAAKPGAYQQGQQVLAAQQMLQQAQAAKPQSYQSKYGPQLDAILQQIQNPQQFKYDFNGDELFKYYADNYTQKGRQAAANVMGQAAALTGGYGNSYGQQVANQTYDQYLLNLYDKGLDLRDRAYQQWQDRRADQYNQYNALAGADERDYGRYRDTVGDWEKERDYLTGRYDTERNFDYGQYQDQLAAWQADRDFAAGRYDTERNYDYSKYRDTVSDWQADRDYATGRYDTERNFDYGAYMDAMNRAEQQYQFDAAQAENTRQFDVRQAEDVRQFNEQMAENQRQYDANMAENQRQYDTSMAENQRQFDAQIAENIRQFDANLDWDKMSAQQKYAAEYAMSILQMGQMPSEALLQQAGLSAEDAKKLMAQIKKGGGGNAGVVYLGPDGKYYQTDKNGLYQQVDRSKVNPNAIVDDSKMMNILVQPSALSTASAITSGIGALTKKDEKEKK